MTNETGKSLDKADFTDQEMIAYAQKLREEIDSIEAEIVETAKALKMAETSLKRVDDFLARAIKSLS